MKKFVIVFGLMLMWVMPAHAQYQEVVDAKVSQLEQMQVKVQSMGLSEVDSSWATAQFTMHRDLLIQHRDAVDLEKLQAIETNINQVSAVIVGKVMAKKKSQLQTKIVSLEALIAEREATGQSTQALKALWEKMSATLQNL